ncbi:MAG: hypothetical protein ACXW1Y_00225, partial [Acidimicrobiia bacterium]
MLRPPTRISLGREIIVAVFGLLVGVAIFASLLSPVDWDASALLRVGEGNDRIIPFVEKQLDHARVVPQLGH